MNVYDNESKLKISKYKGWICKALLEYDNSRMYVYVSGTPGSVQLGRREGGVNEATWTNLEWCKLQTQILQSNLESTRQQRW